MHRRSVVVYSTVVFGGPLGLYLLGSTGDEGVTFGRVQKSAQFTQRVQLECHYGIRAPKTIYGMAFGT